MRSVIIRAAACAAAMAGATAFAQDLGIKAPPQQGTIAIVGAAVHTVSGGVIDNGHVVFRDGKIIAVGSGAPGGSIDTTIDARGKRIYPGLIGANTQTGLVEINAVRATLDYTETNEVSPEVRAAVAVNPDSTIIPVTRSNGVLTVGVMPLGGVIPGRASVVRMDGWTWEDMAVEADAGLMVNWPTMRPSTSPFVRRSQEDQLEDIRRSLRTIDESFGAAAAYLEARKADPSVSIDTRWEAMAGAVSGQRPVFIRAQEVEQIQSAVSWAAGRGLRAVIVGGRDAHLVTEMLKKHDVPVIISGIHRLPRREDSAYDEPFTLPAMLQAAGVEFCIGTVGGGFETPHERNLPYHAATAVAYGLPADVALRSITISAAEVLGVADRLGSIEVGKSATLFIADGDPLEIMTGVEKAFIDGREIDLANKQTDLAEKYREKYRQLGVRRE